MKKVILLSFIAMLALSISVFKTERVGTIAEQQPIGYSVAVASA